MKPFRMQSLLFAIVVLALALTGKSGGDGNFLPVTQTKISATSLVAQATNLGEEKFPVAQSNYSKTPAILESQGRIISFAEPEPPKKIDLAPPETETASLLIKDLSQSATLLEKNIERRWPLASLTKLMTAVIALENLKADQRIIVTENAVSAEGQAGNFKLGEIFSALDLGHAALIISSNDAAVALAEKAGGMLGGQQSPP